MQTPSKSSISQSISTFMAEHQIVPLPPPPITTQATVNFLLKNLNLSRKTAHEYPQIPNKSRAMNAYVKKNLGKLEIMLQVEYIKGNSAGSELMRFPEYHGNPPIIA